MFREIILPILRSTDLKRANRHFCFTILLNLYDPALGDTQLIIWANSQNYAKVAVNFIMSVRLSAWKQLGSHWTDFHEIYYFRIFQKSVEKILVLYPTRMTGYFTWVPIYIFLIISRSVLLRMRNISDKTVEKIKTHMLFSNSPTPDIRAVYDIIWRNVLEPERLQTYAHITYCFSTATVVTRTCLLLTLCVHCLSCLIWGLITELKISLRRPEMACRVMNVRFILSNILLSLTNAQATYTGCNRRNVRDFGRVFLRPNYTDITQNTYIQSWTVTEIMAIEMCGHLGCRRTVRRLRCHTCPMRLTGNETW